MLSIYAPSFKKFLLAAAIVAVSQGVLATPSWNITRIGLTGSEYTNPAYNSQYSNITHLNNSENAAGISYVYPSTGYESIGRDAWIYNGTDTVRVGLIGGSYDSPRVSGARYSEVKYLSDNGHAAGISRRFYGTGSWGEAAWVYDGDSSIRVGLTGSNYTRSGGYEFSQINSFNSLGQAAGYSEARSPTLPDTSLESRHTWFFDGTTTHRIGLFDAAHTRSSGAQYSYISGMNNVGQVIGRSELSNTSRDTWIYQNGSTMQIGLTEGLASHTRENSLVSINDSGFVLGHNNSLDYSARKAWIYNGSTTIQIGLTSAEYTRNDGHQYNEGYLLSDNGYVAGVASRYDGSISKGSAGWIYNGSENIRVGLTGQNNTRSDGYQITGIGDLTQNGTYAVGSSNRYIGNTEKGVNTWIYDGASTKQIGLTDPDFTSADGYQDSSVSAVNEAGQVAGESLVENASGENYGAWFYDNNTTRRIGLTDAMHTRGDGRQQSFVVDLNNLGQVAGGSERYNGIQPQTWTDEWGYNYDDTPWLGNSAWLYDSVSDTVFDLTLSVRQSDNFSKSTIRYLGEDGVVLGEYEFFASNGTSMGTRGFYFSITDGLWDLGDLVTDMSLEGWTALGTVFKANSLGNIAGYGNLSGNNYASSAFILKSNEVPVPSSVWFMFSGLVSLAAVARKKRV